MAGRKPKTPEDRKRYTGKNISGFCQKVRSRRLELGLNQSDLAKSLDCKQSQVSELEGGAFPTSEDRIIAIARALETDPNHLFGFTSEEQQCEE